MSEKKINEINPENIKQNNEDVQKEKETSNLLDEQKILNDSQRSLVNIEKDQELFFYILLTIFAIVLLILLRLKDEKKYIINKNITENLFYHVIESTEPINNFDNRYKNIYPSLTLELKNEFPTLEEIFKGRVLYINDRDLTNKYIKHVRPIDEKQEELYRYQYYKNLKPNDVLDGVRKNLIDTPKFIEICNKEKLINTEKVEATDNPLISIILPAYNKKNEIKKSIRSIQNQSIKNLEIIIVDDCSTENATELYNKLLEEDPRIRIFYQQKNMGIFRTRLNGFLYSRGKFILNFNPGDLFADNLILEDVYNLITKYNLDSIRFSFKTYQPSDDNSYYKIYPHIYQMYHLNITYGRVEHNVQNYGYGTIWNRLIRANVITKGLDLVDSYILNAYKNIWEDVWWNELINFVSFSHLVINRIGYINFIPKGEDKSLNISNKEEKDKTIKEFIYKWLFDYQLLNQEGKEKDDLLDEIKRFSDPTNIYDGVQVNLDYLTSNCTAYNKLLNSLLDDFYIPDKKKKFLEKLLDNYKEKLYNLNNNSEK